MKIRKRNCFYGSLVFLAWLFSGFLPAQAQFRSTAVVSFPQTAAVAEIHTRYVSQSDSLMTLYLSGRLVRKSNYYPFDSATVLLKYRSKVIFIAPAGGEGFYVACKLKTSDQEAFTLAFMRSGKLLGEIKLQTEKEFVRLLPAQPADSLSYRSERPRPPCVMGVKHLVTPKLPESKPIPFKRQVK